MVFESNVPYCGQIKKEFEKVVNTFKFVVWD